MISIPLSFSGPLWLAEHAKPYPAGVVSWYPLSDISWDVVRFVEPLFSPVTFVVLLSAY